MQNNKNNSFSLAITREVLHDQNITLSEKLVYAYILSKSDGCYERAEDTADALGLKVATVFNARQKLETLGYIECIKNDGRGKTYVAKENSLCA